jgi:transposase
VSTKQQQIASDRRSVAARKYRGESLTSIAHHIDVEWLYCAYELTRKDGAKGTDGVGAEAYEANLENLLQRFKSGEYRVRLCQKSRRQGIVKREEQAGAEFINGESREQILMLPDCIDDYITDNNSARVIEAYINSLDIAALGCSRQQPNAIGRPMYDPKDLLKLYLYGYMNRIRSPRRLETESGRNLEVIWLLRTLSPDHKTIAEFRRQNGEALKNVFKGFVKLCVKLGLYGKELLAIDGSKFKAVNSKERNYE